jgi:hypothetical protein
MTASQKFLEKARANAAKHSHLDWDNAWRLTRVENSALYNEMMVRGEALAANQRQRQATPAFHQSASKRTLAIAQGKFQEAVNEQMSRTGQDYHTAYLRVKKLHPELVTEMVNAAQATLPPKVTPSVDGQRLIPPWPVPPEVLTSIGLPMNATREQYEVYKAAEQVTLTPEIAAFVIKQVIQHSQVSGGKKFEDVFDYLKIHQPAMFKPMRTFLTS